MTPSYGQDIITNFFPELVEKVNSLLPSAIRVFTIQRTLGAFHCKNAIDYRVYEYLCPTFAFLPILRAKEGKLDAELLAKVRDFFTIYEGTHNYHNFTIQMKPDDPTGNRHIRSITVRKWWKSFTFTLF